MIVGDRLEQVVTVHGRVYHYATEPRCHTCTSPRRTMIENAVMDNFLTSLTKARDLAGSSRPSRNIDFAAVSRTIPEALASADSIRLHFQRGHHPWFAVVRRMALDDRAGEIARRIAATG